MSDFLTDCAPDRASQEFACLWNLTMHKENSALTAWVAELRALGVVAAMADDGRVDRVRSELRLSCPRFRDDLYFGAIVALGTPDKYRLVQITRPTTRVMPFAHDCFEFVAHDPTKVFWSRRDEVSGEWEYLITDKKPARDEH